MCQISEVDFGKNQKIITNVEAKFELTLSDPVLKYDEFSYSNYKTFSFKADSLKEYTITVSSLCDCLGFNKYMFIPELIVFNENGEIIKTNLDKTYIGGEKMRPISLIKQWKVNMSSNTNYNILLYSNNDYLQKKIFYTVSSSPTFDRDVYVPFFFGMVKSSLIGKFYIEIEN